VGDWAEFTWDEFAEFTGNGRDGREQFAKEFASWLVSPPSIPSTRNGFA
jgi:hypothetical protein